MENKVTITRTQFIIRGIMLGIQAAFFGSIAYGYFDAFSFNLRSAILSQDYLPSRFFEVVVSSARMAYYMIWIASIFTLIISILPTIIGGIISAVCVYHISQKGKINRKRIILIGAMGGLLFGVLICLGFYLIVPGIELITIMIYEYVLGILTAMICGAWVASNLVKDIEKNIQGQVQASETSKPRDLFPLG